MASASQGLVLQSFKGGLNNTDVPSALADDMCTVADNVELVDAPLGERRGGTAAIDITGSGLDTMDEIVHLNTHTPLGTPVKSSELWAVGAVPDTSTVFAHRSIAGAWSQVFPVDPALPDNSIYSIHSQSIHGKLFIMYRSAVDRGHVWDGTRLRKIGLALTSGEPTVATSGNPGAFTEDRLYRVRFAELDGSVIVRQSEPTGEVTFTPPGTDDGAVITRVIAPPGEGETHWIVEASDGDGNFYQIATVPIATTTYTDTIQPATDYPSFGDLSEDIGEYDTVPSFKFVIADQDRLIFGNQWEDPEKGSRVAWTPVWKDTGFGNDERIPANTDNFLDLDWMDGGDLTGLSSPINGSFYAFKWQRIYKLQRTGLSDSAYESFLFSSTHGAIEGSIVNGLDEFGKPSVYFLDPAVGPMRVGSAGIQALEGVKQTWRRVNTGATLISHGVYYPDKRQVHWWLAGDSEEFPTFKIVLHVNLVQAGENKATRGWVTASGTIGSALCSTIVPQIVHNDETDGNYLAFLPFAGFGNPLAICQCDIGRTDNGDEYRARIVSKPFIVAGLLNKWGAMNAALLAKPLDEPETTIEVRFIRDFGREDNYITTDFVPDDIETTVLKKFDNLRMSQAMSIQVEFADPPLGS